MGWNTCQSRRRKYEGYKNGVYDDWVLTAMCCVRLGSLNIRVTRLVLEGFRGWMFELQSPDRRETNG
jgi:hypothetical protein